MSGFRTFAILLSVCSALTSEVNPVHHFPSVPLETNLAVFFFQSRFTTDPQQATVCFAKYNNATNDVKETYSSTYQECLINAKKKQDEIDNEALEKTAALVASSTTVCHRFTVCNDKRSPLDLFQCHSNVGSTNSKDVYEISANASDYFTTYQEKYRAHNLEQEQCIQAAERNYIAATNALYDDLQKCLNEETNFLPTATATVTTP